MKTNKKHNAGVKVPRSELMWVIYGNHGLYTDTALTRKEMIEKHCAALGQTWDYCRERGDRAVKVWVMPLAKYVR
jgi:hypothetical protein